MSALQGISNAVESVPGFSVAADIYEDYAPDLIKTKDPFYVKENGERNRRKAPPNISDNQRRAWKAVIKQAWKYDRNFCGCVGFDLGLGSVPILIIFPVIGPIIAYTLQSTLVKRCAEAGVPVKTQSAMLGNITVDFVISLVPVLGVIFCWLHGCATRNAALFDSWLRTQGDKRIAAAQAHTEQMAIFNAETQRQARLNAAQNNEPGVQAPHTSVYAAPGARQTNSQAQPYPPQPQPQSQSQRYNGPAVPAGSVYATPQNVAPTAPPVQKGSNVPKGAPRTQPPGPQPLHSATDRSRPVNGAPSRSQPNRSVPGQSADPSGPSRSPKKRSRSRPTSGTPSGSWSPPQSQQPMFPGSIYQAELSVPAAPQPVQKRNSRPEYADHRLSANLVPAGTGLETSSQRNSGQWYPGQAAAHAHSPHLGTGHDVRRKPVAPPTPGSLQMPEP